MALRLAAARLAPLGPAQGHHPHATVSCAQHKSPHPTSITRSPRPRGHTARQHARLLLRRGDQLAAQSGIRSCDGASLPLALSLLSRRASIPLRPAGGPPHQRGAQARGGAKGGGGRAAVQRRRALLRGNGAATRADERGECAVRVHQPGEGEFDCGGSEGE